MQQGMQPGMQQGMQPGMQQGMQPGMQQGMQPGMPPQQPPPPQQSSGAPPSSSAAQALQELLNAGRSSAPPAPPAPPPAAPPAPPAPAPGMSMGMGGAPMSMSRPSPAENGRPPPMSMPRPSPVENGRPPASSFLAPTSNGIVPISEAPKIAEVSSDELKAAGDGGGIDKSEEVKIFDPDGKQVHVTPFQLFTQCPFPSSLQSEIAKAGYTKPSQIQANAWPIALQGNDVIGIAATGSGKTVAFLFPAFMHILNHCRGGKDPILCALAPTRELAVQIEKEALKFGQSSGITCICAYGGQPEGQ
eukprot:TRINITY_DN15614_c0_g1_i1.p1 TRINITY_DN15614_c0_g1~~TRINITY_DN15614_c0_g1_i1.p1  ORF type:complete len:303 (+),score=95.08 TRINITY_DN15614_c0_g1_i1:1-909(+)